jgi:hypothetical protein
MQHIDQTEALAGLQAAIARRSLPVRWRARRRLS